MHDKLGILLIIGGMALFSIQDVTIKALAQDGSLLQILVMRSFIGTAFISAFLYISGRPIILTTAYPLLTSIRATLFFLGLRVLYLAFPDADCRGDRVILCQPVLHHHFIKAISW